MATFKPKLVEGDLQNRGEKLVFRALSNLSDEYSIGYSHEWLTDKPIKGDKNMGEIDFILMHPFKGILVIEVKAGEIELNNEGEWLQKNGRDKTTRIIDPFKQARESAFRLKKSFENEDVIVPLINYCVWFVDYQKTGEESFPNNVVDRLVLDIDTLKHPELCLDKVYDYWNMQLRGNTISDFKYRNSQQRSSYTENFTKVKNVIYPNLKFMKSMKSYLSEKEDIFLRLSKEQSNSLDFFENERVCIFNGIAGSGKTLLATLKAKSLSRKDEKVLLLCFNQQLREHLQIEMNDHHNVEVHNAYTLAQKLTGRKYIDDLNKFYKYLESIEFSEWPYQHVIIDEGQDLDDEFLQTLYLFTEEKAGNFYLFYDQNQFVHRNSFGTWVTSFSSKLTTLKRNYRNTNEIFQTSCSLINLDTTKGDYITYGEDIKGRQPVVFFYSGQVNFNKYFQEYAKYIIEQCGIEPEELVILTADSIENSVLDTSVKINEKYKISKVRKKGSIFFTTIRKFKGLEAKAVMIIDLTINQFDRRDEQMLLYVASSRAKHLLYMGVEEANTIQKSRKSQLKSAYKIVEEKKFVNDSKNTYFTDSNNNKIRMTLVDSNGNDDNNSGEVQIRVVDPELDDDIDYEMHLTENGGPGMVHCAEDGKYHDAEEAWMYDGSRY